MKKIIAALIIAATVVCVFAKPKSMAVATFDINNNAVSKDDAEAVTELYIAELVSSGKVDIVDRNNFNKLLKEMQFQTSDWANSEKTVKLGTSHWCGNYKPWADYKAWKQDVSFRNAD